MLNIIQLIKLNDQLKTITTSSGTLAAFYIALLHRISNIALYAGTPLAETKKKIMMREESPVVNDVSSGCAPQQ